VLILTRRQGERIRLGDDIEIEVLGVYRGVVRIGVRAPDNVRVLRAEVASFAVPAPVVASDQGGAEPGASTLSTPEQGDSTHQG
jgi:carbon storage regulator